MRLAAALRSRDLAAAMALALAALVVSLVPAPSWLRAVVVLPTALVVPGYAVSAALFLPGEIQRELRAVLSIVFSISASVLGGLLVQLVLGLDRALFATIVLLVTVGAALVAGRRRAAAPPVERRRPPRLRVSPLAAATLVTAALVAALAIKTATDGVHDQRARSHFSSVWMVPTGAPLSKTAPNVGVGVASHEPAPVSYRMSVSLGPTVLKDWRFRLYPEQRWTRYLVAPATAGGGRLLGRLYRDGAFYQTVSLETGGTNG
jgi:hypothetical protein